MVNIKKLLSLDDMYEIEKEIESLEAVTSGEIVPVIARKSSSYKTVEAVDAFVLSYIFMFIFYAVHKSLTPTSIVVLTIVAMLVIMLMSQFKFLKRIFVPKILMKHKVHSAAMMSFYRHSVYNTKERTGILIYISLMERMVVVIGDEGIHSKVGDEAWSSVISTIVDGIKKKKLTHGIVNGVESCRTLLMKHFPASSDNKNELSNRVIYE
jgi:putative membrane protein